jgi:hypothetical protein
MTEPRIAELLDELTPCYDERRGDWERVAASAAGQARRRFAPFGLVAVMVAATALLVLAWPFHAQQASLLDRARAAIGDGPVLHVVLRGEWGGTLVDLGTGARSAVNGDDEYWYDTRDGRVHSVERLGDAVLNEEISRPAQLSTELEALGRDYKRALETGTAHVSIEGIVDGEPVAWVTIHSELLPDVGDGKEHELAEQVAVSKRTFEPLALRWTRDGKQGPDILQRVLGLEFLPDGAGDFTASPPLSLDGQGFMQGREPMPLDEARATLGRTPLWLGRGYGGLPLAAVDRVTTRIGRRQEARITGREATAAKRCAKLRGAAGGDCFRALGRAPIEVRPYGVFTTKGPMAWSDVQTDVALFYGTLGDDPATYRQDSIPLLDQPHVTVTESAQASPFRPIVGSYVPPAGSVFLAANGSGYLQVDGVNVAIEAKDEEAILAADRGRAPAPDSPAGQG